MAEEYDLIKDSLLLGLKAVKDFYVSCPHCSKRHAAQFPDVTARVKAAEALLNQGLGRPGEEGKGRRDPIGERAARTLKELRELSDEELAELIDADEIEDEAGGRTTDAPSVLCSSPKGCE